MLLRAFWLLHEPFKKKIGDESLLQMLTVCTAASVRASRCNAARMTMDEGSLSITSLLPIPMTKLVVLYSVGEETDGDIAMRL